MSTYKLGLPAELARRLESSLPCQQGTYPPTVRVTPRDRRERKCAAYAADHYEVQAYYTTMDVAELDKLEEALRTVPGVYATTQVRPRSAGNSFTNPGWPFPLGLSRRDRNDLRPQVMALIGDA